MERPLVSAMGRKWRGRRDSVITARSGRRGTASGAQLISRAALGCNEDTLHIHVALCDCYERLIRTTCYAVTWHQMDVLRRLRGWFEIAAIHLDRNALHDQIQGENHTKVVLLE